MAKMIVCLSPPYSCQKDSLFVLPSHMDGIISISFRGDFSLTLSTRPCLLLELFSSLGPRILPGSVQRPLCDSVREPALSSVSSKKRSKFIPRFVLCPILGAAYFMLVFSSGCSGYCSRILRNV